MKRNRLLKFHVLLPVWLCLFFVASCRGAEAEPFEAQGSAGRPVIRRLDEIPQSIDIKNLPEMLNAEEEDLQAFRQMIQPDKWIRTLAIHKDQQDSISGMKSVPPVITQRFAGIENTGNNQPDSILAVGPAHVMVAVNTNVALYTRAGTRRFITSFEDWFSPLAPIAGGSVIFDPRVLYDQYTHHYAFLCTTRRSDHRSWILLSVSKTGDPLGEWSFWAIDMQLNGASRVDLWADFPRLGVDQNALYVTSNMYTFGTYIFRYSKILVLRKSDVYSSNHLVFHEFRQMVDATGVPAHSIEPAHSYGMAPEEFFVNTRQDAADRITLWKVTFPAAGVPALKKFTVGVSSFTAPPQALQKGGGAVINTATEGTGVLSVIYRKGSIYTVFPVAKNWGAGKVSALRYTQIAPTGAVLDEITYGADGIYYYMPAIGVDSKGNVFLAFNRSSSSEFAGFFVAAKKSDNPAFSDRVPLQTGLSNYGIVFRGTNIARWGDYNGITVAGDDSIWAFGQYASTFTEWQTVVAKLSY